MNVNVPGIVVGLYLPLSGGTLTGDLNIGAKKIVTTNHSIVQQDASFLAIRNAADSAYSSLILNGINFQLGPIDTVTGMDLRTAYSNTATFLFKAYENGAHVTLVTLQSSATLAYLGIARTIWLSENAAPTSAVDLVKISGYDLSAGNRSLSISTEHAVAVAAAVASTHKVGVTWNGVTYYILLSNV